MPENNARQPAHLYRTNRCTLHCGPYHTLFKSPKIRRHYSLPERDGQPELHQYQHYVPSGSTNAPWDYVPRHLNWQQYHNPYKAIKKIALYQSAGMWSLTVHDLLICALSNEPISETWPVYKLLQVRNLLVAMVEAFHLIEVRYTLSAP